MTEEAAPYVGMTEEEAKERYAAHADDCDRKRFKGDERLCTCGVENYDTEPDGLSALDRCVEHVLMQVADDHALCAALIVYKDVQGSITFLATGPGRVVDGGFDGYRFTFTETAPDGCGPRLPS